MTVTDDDLWSVPAETIREVNEALLPAVRRLTRNTDGAEDAIQSAWYSVLQRRDVGPIRDLAAYLYAVARNGIVDRRVLLRRRRTTRLSESTEQLDEFMDVPRFVENLIFGEEAMDALNCLRGDEREAFVQIVLRQRTYQQCAVAMNLPLGTVKTRFFRARTRLYRRLRGWEPPDSSGEPPEE